MMPDLEVMHCHDEFIPDWVEYSCFDAEILYFLRETLSAQLAEIPTQEEQMGNNLALYVKYWRPFGELLTDMERNGFRIDMDHLRSCELLAEKEWKQRQNNFLDWIYSTQEDAADFNPASTAQMQQMLFGPFEKKEQKQKREKQAKRTGGSDPFEAEYQNQEVELFRVENTSGFIKEGGTRPLKYRQMPIRGFGLEPISYTKSGMPAADALVIKALAGDDPENGKYGKAYEQFVSRGKEQEGINISIALDNWL
mmetsp:Transcript_27040/g.41182  ORF Transcript_27040/g.41182 Transcript_27040/m.41182 type:complete len:253 (-) Transcript_27040:1006-1764(-)